MDSYLFYRSLAQQLTHIWTQEKKLPLTISTGGTLGVTWTYDEIIYCPYYIKRTGRDEFVYHDSSGFDAYGPLLPRSEVFKALWDKLSDTDKKYIMANTLGGR